MLLAVEDLDIEFIGAAVASEQFRHAVFVVLLVRQFEHRLFIRGGQPADRAADFFRRPVGAAHQPGQADARERAAGRGIEQKLRIRVALQKTRRHRVRFRSFHCPGNNISLVLAPCHQRDFPRPQDGAHTHRDGKARHVLLAEKIRRRILTGDAVQRHEPGRRVLRRSGFIESDVSRAADAEDLQIDAAGLVDGPLVSRAVIEDGIHRHRAVRQMDVLRRDVEMLEQLLLHEAEIALAVVASQTVVLIEIEGDDILEAEALLAVEPYEFTIKGNRGAAGGQAQHRFAAGGVPGFDQFLDLARQRGCGLRGGGVNERGDLFVNLCGGGHERVFSFGSVDKIGKSSPVCGSGLSSSGSAGERKLNSEN
jgi:hypothetical protein